MKLTLLAFAAIALLTSCTENQRAKRWGGTSTVDLPPNTKMIGTTWKDAQLWYLTRPMRVGEAAETSTMSEQSSYGVMQGKVIFKESTK